jgi:acyl carrier protein
LTRSTVFVRIGAEVVPMGAELTTALQRAIAKVCGQPVASITADTRLDDLGVDSLAVAEVIVELEMELDCELPVHLLRQLDRVQTVGDVAEALQQELEPTDIAESSPSTSPS